MPELPEVETIAKRLKKVLLTKSILKLKVLDQRSFYGDQSQLTNVQILDVSRKAKTLSIKLEHKKNLYIHLKMTGQLIYHDKSTKVGGGHPTSDFLQSLPSPHTRLIFELSSDAKLFFNDQRLFGWVKLLSDSQLDLIYQDLPPDVVDFHFTFQYFRKKLSSRSQAIKLVILDQNLVGGIGNIYACDALNLARISPFQIANQLTKVQAERLFEAIKTVIQLGISHSGATTDGKYVDIFGLAGTYQNVARVYNRHGLSCLNCAHQIVKVRQQGRGTYYCPNCQK